MDKYETSHEKGCQKRIGDAKRKAKSKILLKIREVIRTFGEKEACVEHKELGIEYGTERRSIYT